MNNYIHILKRHFISFQKFKMTPTELTFLFLQSASTKYGRASRDSLVDNERSINRGAFVTLPGRKHITDEDTTCEILFTRNLLWVYGVIQIVIYFTCLHS